MVRLAVIATENIRQKRIRDILTDSERHFDPIEADDLCSRSPNPRKTPPVAWEEWAAWAAWT